MTATRIISNVHLSLQCEKSYFVDMPNQPPHVLMLCSWFPNRVQPTNGNFVEKHVRLIAEDFQVTALQVEYDPNLPVNQAEQHTELVDGYELITVYFGSNAGRFRRLLQRLRLFKLATQRILERKHPKLIHVQVAMPAIFIGLWAKLRYRIPFVLSCHSSGFLSISKRQYPWWQRRFLAWTANHATIVCPVSEALAKDWQKNGLKAPIQIIPNVVNTALFYPPKSRPASPPLRLLHISNFDPAAKNVEGILRVAQRLKSENFPFQLTIAGDGDLDRVRTYSQTLGLQEPELKLLGTQTEVEVAQLMQSHHVFVLFSNYETQGVTAIEAVCSGLPVIATKVGGLPEIIDRPERGVLINAKNEDELKQVICQFKAVSPTDRQQAASSAANQFGEESIRSQLGRLYQLP